MVWYEVRALVGALIGLIGFFGFTAVAMAVHAEFAKLLDDRSIARTAADQWSIVVGAVMLAVLATLAIRNIARTGNSPRWSG